MSRRDFQILYVDGDSQHARAAAELLRGEHRHLLRLSESAEVRAYLRAEPPFTGRRPPDLVLLDFDMPSQEGRAILSELKADELLRRIPVVVMGGSGREDVFRAYDSFANCYLTKPKTPEDFKRVLRGLEDFWFSVAKLPRA
jgi:chemotaxis family two-component system response regulator Rcp1